MLYTIGYEGLDAARFVQELKDRDIHILVDVREMPLSRKKGFSKNGLAASVLAEGIEYRHLRELGAPRDVRHRLKETGDWNEYCMGYQSHLEGRDAVLESLAELAQSADICLMCFEADYRECHRSLITEKLSARSLVSEVIHLSPQTAQPSARQVVA